MGQRVFSPITAGRASTRASSGTRRCTTGSRSMARTVGVLWLCFCVTRTVALEGAATVVSKPVSRRPALLAGRSVTTSVVADTSVVTPVGLVPPPEGAGAPETGRLGRRLQALFKRPSVPKVAVNVLLWWALNVVFSLCNKQCLNSWPHPWALACSHLAVGTLCMLPLYIPLPSRSAQHVREWVGRPIPNPRSAVARCFAHLPSVPGLCSRRCRRGRCRG